LSRPSTKVEEIVFTVSYSFVVSKVLESNKKIDLLMKALFEGNYLILSSRNPEEKRKLLDFFDKGYTHLCCRSKSEKYGVARMRISKSGLCWRADIDRKGLLVDSLRVMDGV